jgi:pimeloyl-ACP methyl ester carboxylesterase
MSTHWILLRGLVRHKIHWGDFTKKLASNFPNDSFECIDAAGNGSEAQRKSFLNIHESMLDIRSRRQTTIKTDSLGLLSISLGSMLATEWVHTFPEEIRKIVLINTSDKSLSPFYERLRPQVYGELIKAIRCKNDLEREKIIFNITTEKPELIQHWAATFSKANPTTRANALRQLWAASRYNFPTSAPKCNGLLLVSQNDRLAHPICSQKLSQKWQWPLLSHPWAGHDLPLEDGDWVCEQIKNHFK